MMVIKIEGAFLKNVKDAAEANGITTQQFIDRSIMILLTLAAMDDCDSKIIFDLLVRKSDELVRELRTENED